MTDEYNMKKTTQNRREREKEARREVILEAAERIFSDKGFHGATLDAIAAEAELAKGTLYNYYKDKQDLFLSLMRRGHELFQCVLKSAIDDCDSLKDFVFRLMTITFEGMIRHKYMFRVVFDAGSQLPTALREELIKDLHRWYWETPGYIAEAMLKFPEGRKLPPEDRLNASRLLLVSARILFLDRFLGDDPDRPLDKDLESFIRMISRALISETKA